jgi:hypothetical protein
MVGLYLPACSATRKLARRKRVRGNLAGFVPTSRLFVTRRGSSYRTQPQANNRSRIVGHPKLGLDKEREVRLCESISHIPGSPAIRKLSHEEAGEPRPAFVVIPGRWVGRPGLRKTLPGQSARASPRHQWVPVAEKLPIISDLAMNRAVDSFLIGGVLVLLIVWAELLDRQPRPKLSVLRDQRGTG